MQQIGTQWNSLISHSKFLILILKTVPTKLNNYYLLHTYVSLIFSNPLDCTCELEWLQKLLKSKASKSLLPPVTCKEPQDLSGVELTRIKVL